METAEALQKELDEQIAEEERIEKATIKAGRQAEMVIEQMKIRGNGLTTIGVNVLTLGIVGQLLLYAYSGLPADFFWPEPAFVMFCCLLAGMFLFYEGEDAIRMGYRL